MARHDWREAESPEEAVLLAARYETADEVREALENLGDGDPDGWLDQYGQTALHWASYRMPEVVPELLRAGASSNIGNEDGDTPTMLAASNGHTEAFLAMVEEGADIAPLGDDEGIPDLLHRAAEGGSVEIVRACVEAGHAVDCRDEDGFSPLHFAARHGRNEAAELLLSLGADPNARNDYGETPLHLAWDCADMAALLVAAGAEHSARADDGETPLHRSAEENECARLAFLLDAGADPSVRDNAGLTPMHLAAVAGSFEASRILAPRSDLAAVDENGMTPLHLASNNGHSRVCSMLLEAGADPLAEDSEGRTPVDVAYGDETKSLMLATREKANLEVEAKPAEPTEGQGRRRRI